jgi:hypothetical protein
MNSEWVLHIGASPAQALGFARDPRDSLETDKSEIFFHCFFRNAVAWFFYSSQVIATTIECPCNNQPASAAGS